MGLSLPQIKDEKNRKTHWKKVPVMFETFYFCQHVLHNHRFYEEFLQILRLLHLFADENCWKPQTAMKMYFST